MNSLEIKDVGNTFWYLSIDAVGFITGKLFHFFEVFFILIFNIHLFDIYH